VPAANDSLVTATNACGGNTGIVITHLADSNSTSNCINRFTITRTYIATDACGNSSSKSQTITINGTTPPTITAFPADSTVSCASAVPGANDSLVTATNACGGNSGVIISHNADVITTSNCLSRFTVSRTYVATDACGNSVSKIQTITVNNVTAPTITGFPADATYACSSSVPGANDSLVSATDTCGGASVTITHAADVITSSNCVNHYTITRTYRATDACGNSASKNQTIVVNDNQAPTISCPSPVTVSLPSQIPAPDTSMVTASDNCSVPQKTFVNDRYSTNGYVVTITRTYAASDDCGNSSTCSQTILFNPLLAQPTATPNVYTVVENQLLNVSAPGVLANDTDPNNLPLQAILVTSTTNGTVTLNANGSFHYTPNTYYFGTDTFTYKASNTGTNTSAPVSVAINVGFVNQQPSFTKGADISVLEDSSANTTVNWATNIKPGPVNESNQLLTFVVSNDNSNLFTVQPSIATNGTVTFTPKPITIGSANISVLLHDNGGTNNGGVDTSAPQSFVITVVPVNHAPSFTKGVDQIVNNYAGAQTRLNWATNLLAGPANESGQALNFVVSNTKNSIFNSPPTISTDGTLSFAPASNKYGVATVSVALHDSGGTANGGVDTSASQTFSITVNNPPLVSIVTPTNTSLFLYPSPVTVTADASDLDGYVTNVTFLNGTNVIGQGMAEDDDLYTFTWTNAPSTNSVLYAIATDNYGATNISGPINIQLGNPVTVSGGPIAFSPSLFSWGQKLSVTNPTISTVQSITVTFTSISSGVSVQGVTGTNALGQPFITFNNTVGPVTTVANYATILYVASSQPVVTFVTSASLTAGPTFTVNSTNLVKVTRFQFQSDGSTLVNFLSNSNKTYYVQYSCDLKSWVTSPLP
ncbi:MAG: Ig-like domain-containing protein, partial [Limisphaerales bacterium]